MASAGDFGDQMRERGIAIATNSEVVEFGQTIPDVPLEQVMIFDTTLRDGEQSPGISLDVVEKLEIAEQLARLNVDVIEAGFPIASDGDFEAVEAIAKAVRGPVIAGLSRTGFKDIDRAWDAVQHAEKPRLHVFIATSPLHMEKKLKMSKEQVLLEIEAGVSRAASYTEDVEFSPEDGSRSEIDFLFEALRVAVANGATTLNIPDTVGYGVPEEFGELIASIRKNVPGDYVISTHCHDDLGMAVANSLAGVKAGARQVEVAVNGIGERAGNAALEEVVMAIKTREGYYRAYTNIKTAELLKTSRMVSRLTGYPVQYNKAVVGRNAFAHEAGIHQDGVLEAPETYEIIDATTVGQEVAQIVLGKHSGRHAIRETLAEMGYQIGGDAMNSLFKRFKRLADEKGQISEAELEALAVEEIGETSAHQFTIETMTYSSDSTERASASVTLRRNGDRPEGAGRGNGAIDAAINAVSQATGVDAEVVDFNSSAVTPGGDAMGSVSLRVRLDDTEASGRGTSTDVVEAAARAYLNAVNRIVRQQEKLVGASEA